MGRVRVRVVCAQNLVSADSNGYSDPYVKVEVVGQKNNCQKTSTIKKNLNPMWNEAFEFELGSTPAQEMIDFRVWDWDRLSADDPLGSYLMPMDGLYRGEEKLGWYDLIGADHGSIQVGVTALDFGLDRGEGAEQSYPPQEPAPAPQDRSYSDSPHSSPSLSHSKSKGNLSGSLKTGLKASKSAGKAAGKVAGTVLDGLGTVLSVVDIFGDD